MSAIGFLFPRKPSLWKIICWNTEKCNTAFKANFFTVEIEEKISTKSFSTFQN
jgi:hypothetical protein